MSASSLRLLRALGWHYSPKREAWVHRIGNGRRGPVFVDRRHPPAPVHPSEGGVAPGPPDAPMPPPPPPPAEGPSTADPVEPVDRLPRRTPRARPPAAAPPEAEVEAEVEDEGAEPTVRVDGRPPRLDELGARRRDPSGPSRRPAP